MSIETEFASLAEKDVPLWRACPEGSREGGEGRAIGASYRHSSFVNDNSPIIFLVSFRPDEGRAGIFIIQSGITNNEIGPQLAASGNHQWPGPIRQSSFVIRTSHGPQLATRGNPQWPAPIVIRYSSIVIFPNPNSFLSPHWYIRGKPYILLRIKAGKLSA